MPTSLKRCLVAVICFVIGIAAAEELPKGTLIERVATRANPEQTYALYLPTQYSADREWPIVYGFDPGARGRIPVERFHEGAERYGYIVVGSNNSRNGPWEPSLAAIVAIWADTHERFRINAKRTYATGFSGGARVACQMASAPEMIAGVIVGGATFPGSTVPKTVTFAFFGAVGTEDFNYQEIKRAGRELAARKLPHWISVYPGAHQWFPPSVAAEGIEWMEVQAMAKGLRPPDAELQAKFAQVAVDKDAEKQERKIAAREERLVNDMMQASREWETNQRSFQSEMSMLKKDADAPVDSDERRMARRVLGGAFVNAMEAARGLNARREHRQALMMTEQALVVRPGNAAALREMARAYEGLGNNKRAEEVRRKAETAQPNPPRP